MRTVEWVNGKLRMIDQRKLPWELVYCEYDDFRDVAHAVSDMVIRGAPAIGAAGAFGLALAARQSEARTTDALLKDISRAAELITNARPTAVNLAWAVQRVMTFAEKSRSESANTIRDVILSQANALADEDVAINRTMGEHGAALIQDGDTILHHCNTGALATVDWGTALGVIRSAHEQGKKIHVLLDETRPRLQGARLSAWELTQYKIPFDVIADNASGHYMRTRQVNIVLVGSDRTAANGDVANKIGTYNLSVIAKENEVPFFPVVPTSTIDLNLTTGDDIPIEERSGDELRKPYGHALMPDSYPARNPAFDVTPNRYVTGIVTEVGVVYPPFNDSLLKAVNASRAKNWVESPYARS